MSETPKEEAKSEAVATKRPHFATVRPRRAFEEICEQIRNEIAAGVLVPGDRLPAERELAEQFGVSRTAVREALRTLEVAGLVRCQTGIKGGAFVTQADSQVVTRKVEDMVRFGQTSVDEVTEARIHLTCMAIALACERATEEDLDRIEADIQRSEELTALGDFTRRTNYIIEFYHVLALATHNSVIVMLLDSLSEITRALMAKVDPTPRPGVAKIRRRILEHMRARNAKLATAEMTRHLQYMNKYLKEQQEAHRSHS